ncbi:cold-shock protein [Streptacidiphilus rugosus]|uniref:cold-shock protein n=1 Tax=Streptacidiphilus rugosus TaxID=405783 RepID=UPI00069208C1|nr:cold-shock protein [Streptacidiphilus rugosus]
MSYDNKAEGQVKWFNSEKGFGFIAQDSEPDKPLPDVFVHYSAIIVEPGKYRELVDGQRVRFLITRGQKGLQAEEVEPLSKPVQGAHHRH